MVERHSRPGIPRIMSDTLTSLMLPALDPQRLVGLLALATIFVNLLALGASLKPLKAVQEDLPARPLLLTLAAALVGVPLVTLALAGLTGLRGAALAGILLVGISPGAPLALRRSRGAGATSGYPAILQVLVAILAVPAVPAWILIMDAIFGASAWIGVGELARQVFLSQILPLACGVALALRVPALAAKLAKPMMRLGTVLLVVLVAVVVSAAWRTVGGVPWQALLCSLGVAVAAVALGHGAGAPGRETRVAGAIVCALRNPGIALMIASASAFPLLAKAVIIAHVLVTAVILTLYLAAARRLSRRTGDAQAVP